MRKKIQIDINCTWTVSLYGPNGYGIGHITDGRPAEEGNGFTISIEETWNAAAAAVKMLVEANKLKTGDKIKVTLTPIRK